MEDLHSINNPLCLIQLIAAMKNSLTLVFVCLVAALPLLAQQPTALEIEVPSGSTPWTSLDFNTSDDQFQFVIVTDRTGGHRPGVFPEAMRKVNLLQPEFVISVGDLIEGYTEDMPELLRQWEEFDGFVNQLESPFFYVPGNHDITNKVMQDLWKERLGPTYYHFVYKDVLFLCLDSEDQYRGAGNGSISDTQYEYIKKTLEENADVRWTLVFMHQPLWTQEDPVRWPDVEKLLSNREHSVFTGHVHHYVRWERNNGRYFTLATTGGGSALRGPKLGEFDHVVWVTMTDQGPIIANLQLSGIWTEDVVTNEDYDFISSLQSSIPVRIEPIYYQNDPGAGGTVNIQITNPMDMPVLVRVDDQFSFDMTSTLETDTMTIGPNNVGTIGVELAPRKDQLAPEASLPLHVSLAYTMPNGSVIEVPFEYQVGMEQQYPLPIGDPVAVDGVLEEWSDLPYQFSGPEAADLSAAFDVRLDDEFLYLAARVQDDEVKLDKGAVAWQQDYIGFTVNADPIARSAMRTGSGWYSNSFTLALTPSTDELPSKSFYEERYEGIDYQWVAKVAEGGYTMEAAIPLSYFRQLQGDDWRTARINFTVQDWDSGEEDKPRYSWQPDWRSSANRVGSGMFFRNPKSN